MVSTQNEMANARRRLSQEIDGYNMPDALQVLDKAVGGLIDLAKGRVTEGVTAKEVDQTPFGDYPEVPSAGRNKGDPNLKKFGGVYSNSQNVRGSSNRRKGTHTKNQQSVALPKFGKAAPMAGGPMGGGALCRVVLRVVLRAVLRAEMKDKAVAISKNK